MSTTGLKHIVISEENFQILKRMGQFGDSFNDIISRLLREGKTSVSHPKEFEHYDALNNHFRQFGAQLTHKVIGDRDFVTVVMTVDKPIPHTFNLFYRKTHGKFVECSAQDRMKQEDE